MMNLIDMLGAVAFLMLTLFLLVRCIKYRSDRFEQSTSFWKLYTLGAFSITLAYGGMFVAEDSKNFMTAYIAYTLFLTGLISWTVALFRRVAFLSQTS